MTSASDSQESALFSDGQDAASEFRRRPAILAALPCDVRGNVLDRRMAVSVDLPVCGYAIIPLGPQLAENVCVLHFLRAQS